MYKFRTEPSTARNGHRGAVKSSHKTEKTKNTELFQTSIE
ncbi:hypothetical protein LEP1GSC192_2124 [Leptospira sp. B5-022]|nr:hypothetical protein LEP1GSC192_2124 [Leptospira sp. B5-022]